jgi:hypothetical protein
MNTVAQEEVMDTKTLVVGQDVYMLSGVYICWGKVVKITPSGVDVQTDDQGLLRFNSRGEGYDKGTHECGPWYIDDIPFAERTALRKQGTLDYEQARLKRDENTRGPYEHELNREGGNCSPTCPACEYIRTGILAPPIPRTEPDAKTLETRFENLLETLDTQCRKPRILGCQLEETCHWYTDSKRLGDG